MEPSGDEPQELGSCEFSFKPKAELVSVVRRFLKDFFGRVLNNPEAVSRMTLAAHELLENAVKYAESGETSIHVRIGTEGESTRISIRTRNCTSGNNLRVVCDTIDELKSAADPLHHYLSVMQRTCDCVGTSGLGLARIRAETDMEIDWSIQGNQLIVTVETALPCAEERT
jgi:anti-sigma regulatory factor (Ser/Thr protein kinase)